MKEKLDSIREIGLKKLESAGSIRELEEVYKELTGKKSELTEILKNMGTLTVELKKEIGIKTTEIKSLFESKFREVETKIIENQSVLDSPIDLSVPGVKVADGVMHPITEMCNDLNEAFLSLGFEVFSENDISSEKYAFDNLNFAKDHPARESMDTYWLLGTEDKKGI